MYPLENSSAREEKRAKSKRLEARITAKQKEILQLAATIEGRSIILEFLETLHWEEQQILFFHF